jgi:hypothetical protein
VNWLRWHTGELATVLLLTILAAKVSWWWLIAAAAVAGGWCWQEWRVASARQRLAPAPAEREPRALNPTREQA